MVFKKDLTPLAPHSKKGEIHKYEGKGSREDQFAPPSARFPMKMSRLHGGEPHKREAGHYGKEGNAPDGVSAMNPTSIPDDMAAPMGGGAWGGDSM